MSVRDILTAAELEDLRSRWKADCIQNNGQAMLARMAEGQFGTLDKSQLAWIAPIGEYFFRGPAFSKQARDRELAIIAIATSTDPNGPTLLPIHLFWGLMEGLEPDEIADAIGLTGVYSGLQNFIDAIRVFDGVLRRIKAVLDGAKPPKAPRNALDAIARAVAELRKPKPILKATAAKTPTTKKKTTTTRREPRGTGYQPSPPL